MSSSTLPSSTSPLFRVAIFGGAVIVAVTAFSLYREWRRRSGSSKSVDDVELTPEEAARILNEADAEQLRRESEQTRKLREEQDLEYILSEAADAEKDRQRRLEEEMKLRHVQETERQKLKKIEILRKKLGSLPSPPASTGVGILDLNIMLPELENSPKKPQRISRKWVIDSSSLNDLFDWVETLALPDFGSHQFPDQFVLRSDFPKVVYKRPGANDPRVSLKEIGLSGRVVLHVEEVLDAS